MVDVNVVGFVEIKVLILGGMVEMYEMDVCDCEVWVMCFDVFMVVIGGWFDVLFNNVGIGIGGLLVEISFEEIDWVIVINLVGVFNGV